MIKNSCAANMKPGHLHLTVVLLLVLPVITAGCRPTRVSENVCHVVVCWLKQPGDQEARRRIVEVSKGFSAIPGVLSVRAGTVLQSERETVDDSFDVAIVISFEDTKALASYLKHPRHKKALNEVLRPLVRRVTVYDFVEG